MKYNKTDILQIIKREESATLEFKESRILKNPTHLAETMATMANSDGGLIIIGIRNDGSIEGMKFKKGHEEHIMNVAVTNISPYITPIFEVVNLEQGVVYVLTIPKRKGGMWHGVKTKSGLVYKKRVGSRTIEVPPEELTNGEMGVEVKPKTSRFYFWAGSNLLKISRRLNISFRSVLIIMGIISALLFFVGFLLIFEFENGMLTVISGYTTEILYLAAILMFAGAFFAQFVISMHRFNKKTRCPSCKSPFSFNKVGRFVLNKRTISEELEEWTCRNTYRCDACKIEESKNEYEKHKISPAV